MNTEDQKQKIHSFYIKSYTYLDSSNITIIYHLALISPGLLDYADDDCCSEIQKYSFVYIYTASPLAKTTWGGEHSMINNRITK